MRVFKRFPTSIKSTIRRYLYVPAAMCVLTCGVAGRADGATVGYWRFENGTANTAATASGSILDSSGNGNNGTPVNAPTYSSSVLTPSISPTGTANQLSMLFNGANQRIFIPDAPSLAVTQSLTLEAFINPISISGGEQQIVFRGDDRPYLDPYFLELISGSLKFQVADASGNTASVLYPFSSANQWSEVAGTLNDATGVMNLYINDVQVATTTTAVRPFATLTGANPGLGIGDLESLSVPEYFNGNIDEVRISNQALSANQLLSVPEPTAFLMTTFCSVITLCRRRRGARTIRLDVNRA